MNFGTRGALEVTVTVAVVAAVSFAATPGAAQAGKTHELKPTLTTVAWGYYDAAAKPVLTVASGDIVEVETVLHSAEVLSRFGMEAKWITDEMRVFDQIRDRGAGGHLLVGPVAVQGAEPGDVLEVRILDVRGREPFGINVFRPNGGTLPADFPYGYFKTVPVDLQANVAHFAPNIEFPLAPFFGSLGVAPPAMMGRISSGPPGIHTGNLDNKDLVSGTILYIPVHVTGALLFIGDGHLAQGHGEVDGTALEGALSGRLQLIVRKDLELTWPRAETPTHYITMGLAEDLDEAARMATREMVKYLTDTHHLTPADAYALASMVVDLHVTQMVDGVKGVHATVPKSIFKKGR
ncbi:MAG: acetamidase/formamidase family protein [Gemmatimonadales bacterium]